MANSAQSRVKKSKDFGAFCWEKLVKFGLLSSDFRIFPNMGLFFNTRYVVQTFDLPRTGTDLINTHCGNISGLFRFLALNAAFQNRRKMQNYGLFNLVFKPYVVCG